jgi:hypothetical protein
MLRDFASLDELRAKKHVGDIFRVLGCCCTAKYNKTIRVIPLCE